MNEELIKFSENAMNQIPVLQSSNPEWQGKAIRVYLSGKGCDGFDYGVCFDDVGSDDLVVEASGIKIIIDPESLKFVRGSSVEWVDDERGKGFLVENPNHKKFRGKFYKKKDWEARLLSTRTDVNH